MVKRHFEWVQAPAGLGPLVVVRDILPSTISPCSEWCELRRDDGASMAACARFRCSAGEEFVIKEQDVERYIATAVAAKLCP